MMKLHEYTYNQLIKLDMTCGGLTKKKAVQSRQLDRRWKKAHRNVVMLKKAPKCRMERSAYDVLCDYFDDLLSDC